VATILIVDDHEVVRRGVRAILGARPEWEVIGEATNGRDAIEAAQAHRPDVVILDISMPVMNGLEVAPCIVSLGCRVLVFTMHESKELIAAIRATGAHGFVQKEQAGGQLIGAIDMCLSGSTFVVSPRHTP
jgi:DNA-binding NarL/FixJ family response regulator